MATFTRKFLKGMQLTDEQVDAIIDAHADVVSGLKDQIDELQGDAEKLAKVQKELDDANEKLASSNTDSYKAKYEAVKEEYDAYKDEQTKKATHDAKTKAYRDLLKSAGVSEKRIDTVLKCSKVDDIDLNKDGEVKGADDLLKEIKDEWSDFIQTTEQKGASVATPPNNTGGTVMTKEDIMKIKDPTKRQDAIAKNIELFTSKGEN